MGAEEWNDPHGVLPQSFKQRYDGCETVAEALRLAQSQDSTTPDAERPKCPYCGSTAVEQRTDRSFRQKPDADAWKCRASGCYREFDTPADETHIPMTDERADPFEWIADDQLTDPDERTALDPPLADVDRETAVAVALWLREPWRDAAAPSYTEIARWLPFGDSWVGHRVREWRDGEHRELVPEPEPEPEPTADASSDATAVATDGGRRSRWGAYGSD